jgi:ribosome modulation factor
MKAYQNELDKLLTKRDRLRQQQMDSYRNGTATRARTTTRNAEADRLNERIVWLREQMKETC